MPFERKRMIKYIEKTPITQGWSDDYKHFALGADGKKYLLRVTPGKINPDFITLFEAQKKCASIISAAENIPMQQVPMSIPIECGKLDDIHAFVMIFYSTPKEHMLFMPGRTAARPNPLLQ